MIAIKHSFPQDALQLDPDHAPDDVPDHHGRHYELYLKVSIIVYSQ